MGSSPITLHLSRNPRKESSAIPSWPLLILPKRKDFPDQDDWREPHVH